MHGLKRRALISMSVKAAVNYVVNVTRLIPNLSQVNFFFQRQEQAAPQGIILAEQASCGVNLNAHRNVDPKVPSPLSTRQLGNAFLPDLS